MNLHKINYYICFILSILLTGCAQVVPLSGGKRDVTAPKVLSTTPLNQTINFNEDNIIIKFDEFIQFKDVNNEFIVSPTLKTKPTIQSIGKSLIINLNKEELLKNTTYKLSFGNSIKDMHESNPLKDYEFIFSTGNTIDTLKQSGQIVDALTKEAETEMIVGLYDLSSFNDSTIFKSTPLYYCKTKTSGHFQFSNLPNNTFKIIAFTDKNKNLLYEPEVEKIAFSNENILPGKDTTIFLTAFTETPHKTYIKKINVINNGKAIITFNKPITPKVNSLNSNINYFSSTTKPKTDSLLIYSWPYVDTLKLSISDDFFNFKDTVKIIYPKNNKKNIKFPISTSLSNKLLPFETNLTLTFPQVIDTSCIKQNQIFLFETKDSLKLKKDFNLEFVNGNSLKIKAAFLEDKAYSLKIDTNTFCTFNKNYNDSLSQTFKLQAKTSLGNIKLNVLLNKKQNYLIQLISPQGNVYKQTNISFALSESNEKIIYFKNITPGNYKLWIVFDDDNNKEWTTGNYLKQIQPEKIEIFEKELKVISDWEIEEEVTIKK